MGFTGEKALDFKIRYIQAFDAMEAALIEKKEPKRIAVTAVDVLPDETLMGNPNTWAVWSWCLSRAVSAPCRKLYGNVQVDLAAGELIFTESMIATDVNLNRHMISRCLDFLMKYGKITRRSTNKFSIITIPDWAERKAPVPVKPLPAPASDSRRVPVPEPSLPVRAQSHSSGIPEQVNFLIEHYKSMIAGYREEIAGYRGELSFYRGLYRGVDSDDYAKLTDKARKCLSSLAPAHANMTRESLVEMAVCMVAGSKPGRRMDS